MAQIKEQIRTSEKELSDEEIVNLSDAEFKTLVIRILTEMPVWLQNKGKYIGNSEGKETGTQRFGTKGRNKHSTGTE